MAADGQGSNRSRVWHRASMCSPKGNCVEVSRMHGSTVIRDSKGEVELPALGETQWTAFVDFCAIAN
jgi:hypothetical protein